MTKRIVGATLLGLLASITAVAASCSFPTYNINVGTGTGGGASASSSGDGGAGGAASTTSATASSSATSTTSSATTSSASSSSTGGSCPTDADGDTYVSAKCPGGLDCADGDVLANPKGDFHSFPIENVPVGTLPFDFNCNGSEEAETLVLKCGVDCSSKGFQANVACGASAPLGKCAGFAPLCSFTPVSPAESKQQRCK